MDILQKAKEGEQKEINGKNYYYHKLENGKFSWRRVKEGETKSENSTEEKNPKVEKLKEHLKNTETDKLHSFASNEANDGTLRKLAHDELKKRGEDVSKIDLNTGKTKRGKELFGSEDSKTEEPKKAPDAKSKKTDKESPDDWEDKEAINEHFTGKSNPTKTTKEQRINIDNHIHNLKIKDKNYKSVQKQIAGLNISYARFLKSKSPLMISTGGAGLGKTYNFKEIAKYMDLKPFNEDRDMPGEDTYDYFEAPETKTPPNLVQLLKEHNGKTIVFDDSDAVWKNPENLGILKKATASSGNRIVGWKSKSEDSNIDPFNFTGQILIISNADQNSLTKDEHINAVYSRAIKNDIQATKREKIDAMKGMIHNMDFHGLDRLPNKEDDKKEREEAFKLIEDNADKIDPAKFSSRTFKEILEKKRAVDDANELIKKDPVMGKVLFGDPGDWKKEVEDYLVKGIDVDYSVSLEKALENIGL